MTVAQASTSTVATGRAADVGRRRWRHRRSWVPWLFLAPGLLFALTFKFLPMVEGVRISLVKVQPFLGDQFVGTSNYARVLGDPRFQAAFGHTLVIGVAQAVGALVVGLLLALLLEGDARVLAVVRTAVFLPVVTAVAVIGEIWRVLYFPTESGLLNHVLGLVGVAPQGFTADPSTALVSVIVVGIWTGAPYDMAVLLAGLAGIDRSLYEAAAIDGAGVLQRLRHIVAPGLRASLSVVVTLAAIRSLRTFTEVYVLTGGGPAGATDVWMTRIYSAGFQDNQLGVAAAASMLLLAATLLLTITTRRLTVRGTT